MIDDDGNAGLVVQVEALAPVAGTAYPTKPPSAQVTRPPKRTPSWPLRKNQSQKSAEVGPFGQCSGVEAQNALADPEHVDAGGPASSSDE